MQTAAGLVLVLGGALLLKLSAALALCVMGAGVWVVGTASPGDQEDFLAVLFGLAVLGVVLAWVFG